MTRDKLNKRKIVITGSNGFVGSSLCEILDKLDYPYIPVPRNFYTDKTDANFRDKYDLKSFFNGAETVIHLAGLTEPSSGEKRQTSKNFEKVNVVQTENILGLAAEYNIKRFIFLSTIKVNGEWSSNREPFKPSDVPSPQTDYSISKLSAEKIVIENCSKLGMEWVIVRVPLVYGPRVKGNFRKLIKFILKSDIIPLGIKNNNRSMIGLSNLCDFLVLCGDRAVSRKAANELFLISDGPSISTKVLVEKIAQSHKRVIVIVPIPIKITKFLLNFIGMNRISEKLFSCLELDISKAERLLGWKPKFSMEQELKKLVEKDAADF